MESLGCWPNGFAIYKLSVGQAVFAVFLAEGEILSPLQDAPDDGATIPEDVSDAGQSPLKAFSEVIAIERDVVRGFEASVGQMEVDNPLSPPRMMLSTSSLKKQIPSSQKSVGDVYSSYANFQKYFKS
jgi:hypothetical protein